LLVLAGSGQATLTAETYADVIRFGVQGAGTVQIQIYDLSEKELWNSGAISSDFVDWDRTDTWGERLANGYYLYLAQAWDVGGSLILSKTGKVALLPGDQVQLQAAPVRSSSSTDVVPTIEDSFAVTPKAYTYTNLYVSNRIGVGTDAPTVDIDVSKNVNGQTRLAVQNPNTGASAFADLLIGTGVGKAFALQKFGSGYTPTWSGMSTANWARFRSDSGVAGLIFTTGGASPLVFGTSDTERVRVTASGNVGIGTTSPTKKLQVAGDSAVTGLLSVGTTTTAATDKLTIQGATGNLIACYPDASRTTGSAVFRVESDGDTYADGSVYAADIIITSGAADVAERINASEWVEAGNVVEIDPEHPGFFRKSAGAYSTRVGGIISTSPGVVLGQKSDSEDDQWGDTRPVLAIAGRVPVKVTTENGPIAVGDLLVASSTPGIAMKGDPSTSIGCVVGKAMEPFAEGEGVVMAQVMLR
jgi:hypothetical protein